MKCRVALGLMGPLPQGACAAARGVSAHHHDGQECRLAESGYRHGKSRRAVTLLAAGTGEVPEPHRRAGPSECETTNLPRARFWQLLECSTNTGML
jgi:hypothetical protein